MFGEDGAEVSVIDALFTSTSAVCVTGLIAIDTADHFTALGQAIVALLIQIGGLGVTSVGVGIMIAAGRKVGLRGRTLVKEALNVDSYGGLVKLVKAILITTVCFETAGAVLSFIVFVQDYAPLHALGISVFHSVAAFNNSGFDTWEVSESDSLPGQYFIKLDDMYVDFLWGDWFPGHHGCTETKELPEACSPFQGSPDDKYSIDCSWNSTLKIYRTHFLDGGFFS